MKNGMVLSATCMEEEHVNFYREMRTIQISVESGVK